MSHLLLAIDSSGYPSRWLQWQDAIAQEVLGRVSYCFGDHEFTFRGGTNRLTGQQSRVTLRSIVVLHGRSPEAGKRRSIALTNAALFRRDRYMCAYCGKVSRSGLTRDHIVPLSRGGRDTWSNCCTCCIVCNSRKGARLPEELGWDLLYVPYVPNHQEGLILENRRILADQMELLSSMVPRHSRLAG